MRIADTNLTEAAFVPLASGQTIEVTVEMAALHDLTSGGDFDVVAQGAVPYALEGTTELTGDALSFLSKVKVNVDEAKAALVPRAINLEKRSALQSGCSSSQRTATVNALANCQRLASSAASAASSGNAAKFNEYFKSTTTSVRNTVAARLRAVASECGSSTSGATRYYCTDVYGYCESNVLAYTLPSQNVVVNCPLYYSALSALTTTCHAQDQATTTLHEMTHAPAVYSPGTLDNGYGYAAATRLSSSQAVNNADSYALYSNGMLMPLNSRLSCLVVGATADLHSSDLRRLLNACCLKRKMLPTSLTTG